MRCLPCQGEPVRPGYRWLTIDSGNKVIRGERRFPSFQIKEQEDGQDKQKQGSRMLYLCKKRGIFMQENHGGRRKKKIKAHDIGKRKGPPLSLFLSSNQPNP